MTDPVEFTTADAVAAHLKLSTADAACTSAAAAANAFCAGHDDLVDADGNPTESAKLGATMLAARLVRRRNSPAGIEAVTQDAAVYVARTDPDVMMLLRLDQPGIA